MRSLITALCGFCGLIAGCGGSAPKAPADSSRAATSGAQAPVGATSGNAPCRPTGQWTDCTVFERLDHAGLAPRRDSSRTKVDLPPLTTSGTRLALGNSELDVFLYPDAAAREKDEARLDHGKFIEASAEPTLRGEATLIRNVNLLAVLHSRNDHQRERVSDALTAGPPTPGTGSIR